MGSIQPWAGSSPQRSDFTARAGVSCSSRSLIPIALGHAAAIAVVVFAVVGLGMAIDTGTFRIVAGLLLIAWGVYHWLYGHHHHFPIGVATGLVGLGVWSFLMATAHGAGVMLIPVLMPLEQARHAHQMGAHVHHMMAMDSFGLASLAVVVHSLAMLIVTGTIALLVYQSAGFEMLKRSWINLDVAWTIALIGMGAWLLFF